MADLHPINTPCAAWERMQEESAPSRAVLGGVKKLRDMGEEYLPRNPKEVVGPGGVDPYKSRLKNTLLWPGLERAVSSHTARVHSEPIVRGKGIRPELLSILDDVDGQGTSLDSWAPNVFRVAIGVDGVTHILIDQPPLPPGATDRDRQRLNMRPTWTHVTASELIGWKHEQRGSQLMLSEIRRRERIEKPDPKNDYNTVSVNRVRLLRPGYFEIWEEKTPGKEDFEIVEDNPEAGEYGKGSMSLDYIPLVTFYACRCLRQGGGFVPMMGRPYFRELTEVNLTHYRSDSAQRYALAFARVPQIVSVGTKKGEGGPESFGSGVVHHVPIDGGLSMLEHGGAAISAGSADLQDLEQKMEILGMVPLSARTVGVPTATEIYNKAAEATSDMQAISLNWSAALSQALEVTGDWLNLAVPQNALRSVTDFSAVDEKDDISLVDSTLRSAAEFRERGYHQVADALVKALEFRSLIPDSDDPSALLDRVGPSSEPS